MSTTSKKPERKIKTIRVSNLSEFCDEETSLEKLIGHLAMLKNSHPQHNLFVKEEGDYDWRELVVFLEEPEAEESYRKRLDKWEKRQEIAREKRRKKFEELKKEFEND